MWIDFKIPTLQELQQMAGTTNAQAVARVAYQYATPEKLLNTLGLTDDVKGNLHVDKFEVARDFTSYSADNRWLMQGQIVHINVVGSLWNKYCDAFDSPLKQDEIKDFAHMRIEDEAEEPGLSRFDDQHPPFLTASHIIQYFNSSFNPADEQCILVRDVESDVAFRGNGDGFVLKTTEDGSKVLHVYSKDISQMKSNLPQPLTRSTLRALANREPDYSIGLADNSIKRGYSATGETLDMKSCKEWLNIGFDWLIRTSPETRAEELAEQKLDITQNITQLTQATPQ